MKLQLEITASIPISEFVTDITFSDTVMVSIDCCGCKRCMRSIVFDKSGFSTYCTPTKHKFNGKIIKLKSTKNGDMTISTCIYLIEYEFELFVDAKYPNHIPSPGSNWARVKCIMRCKCGSNISWETQNNLGRPFNVLCECGAVLSREIEENPKIKKVSYHYG